MDMSSFVPIILPNICMHEALLTSHQVGQSIVASPDYDGANYDWCSSNARSHGVCALSDTAFHWSPGKAGAQIARTGIPPGTTIESDHIAPLAKPSKGGDFASSSKQVVPVPPMGPPATPTKLQTLSKKPPISFPKDRAKALITHLTAKRGGMSPEFLNKLKPMDPMLQNSSKSKATEGITPIDAKDDKGDTKDLDTKDKAALENNKPLQKKLKTDAVESSVVTDPQSSKAKPIKAKKKWKEPISSKTVSDDGSSSGGTSKRTHIKPTKAEEEKTKLSSCREVE